MSEHPRDDVMDLVLKQKRRRLWLPIVDATVDVSLSIGRVVRDTITPLAWTIDRELPEEVG